MYGLLWAREAANETFEEVLESGYNYYKNKYKDEPTIIECSNQECKEEFIYKNAKVSPSPLFSKGTIWISGKYFQKSSDNRF